MVDPIVKKLRANPTDAERRLWRLLYPLRTNGFHFRKQVRIGSYIVDIACHHAKLVIEVDGSQHWTAAGKARDAVRDTLLHARGYTVLRFTNHDVLTNPDGVHAFIHTALERQHPARRTETSS